MSHCVVLRLERGESRVDCRKCVLGMQLSSRSERGGKGRWLWSRSGVVHPAGGPLNCPSRKK